VSGSSNDGGEISSNDSNDASSAADVITPIDGGPDAADANVLANEDAGPAWFLPDPSPIASAYQINPAHTGSLDDARFGGPLSRLWSVDLPCNVSYPIIARGRVVVICKDHSTMSFPTMYAYDALTGHSLWKVVVPTSKTAWPFGAIAYEAGRVFAVGGDNVLYAFNLFNGVQLFATTLPLEGNTNVAPVALNGTVYQVADGVGDYTYAVAADTGTIRWMKGGDGTGSPAVDSQSACFDFVALQSGCRDVNTGAIQWAVGQGIDGGGALTAVLYGGRVFIRDDSHNTRVYDATTGAISPTTYVSDTLPAFHGAQAFLLSKGILTAADASTFVPKWTFGDGKLMTAPIIVGGVVYVGSSTGTLYGLDETTGTVVWSDAVGSAFTSTWHDEEFPMDVVTSIGAAEGFLVAPAGKRLVAYGAPLPDAGTDGGT
jgi:outer membrane protein assembly factor BamB